MLVSYTNDEVVFVPWSAPIPCSSALRRIRSSRMIEVDVYSFCWVAQSLNWVQVHMGAGIVRLGTVAPSLGNARIALEHLDAHTILEVLPDTAQKIKELIAQVDSLVPRDPQQVVPNRNVAQEMSLINRFINEFFISLRDELKRKFVLCVEDQRCLSAYTLMENIESCFHQKSWTRMGDDAKREFGESGKCLALERYTGAGFHSLRGVECVIRQWILEVTGSLPRKRDWGHYVEVLKQNNADAGLTAVLDNIRSLERNPLMHPEDWLDVDDSVGIFNLSHTAVARLVGDLEGKKPKGAPLGP